MLDNVRMNFRRIEDVFNGWNKECMLMNDLFEKGLVFWRKIKEILEGLKEVDEFGKNFNRKFD